VSTLERLVGEVVTAVDKRLFDTLLGLITAEQARLGHLFRHARRHARRRARRVAPVDAGRHTDQHGEATAEGAQRRPTDRETDLDDAEVATTPKAAPTTGANSPLARPRWKPCVV